MEKSLTGKANSRKYNSRLIRGWLEGSKRVGGI